MSSTVRNADSKGRIVFPGWANATVIIEAVGVNEFRVRKAKVIPEDDLHFPEEDGPVKLSRRDAAKFLGTIQNPPKPNQTLRKAARRFKAKHG
jgi:hypothetical protein